MPKQDDTITLVINGKRYEFKPDDLTVDEIEVIEDEFDKPISAMSGEDWQRTKMTRCIVYILLNRDGNASMEEVRALKLSDLADPEDAGPPTKRRSPAKQSA